MGNYNFTIFKAKAVRKERLNDGAYRHWSSYAIAHVFGQRLSGQVDVLDAGGRDGGTLKLLENLSLTGSYTCLDLKPTMIPPVESELEIDIVESAFADFKPPRKYDAVLFESSLDCVEHYRDVSWLADCLKPGGFVVVTLATRKTRALWPGFWERGGRYYLDSDEIAPAFAAIGLKLVELTALTGVSGRVAHCLIQLHLAWFCRGVFLKTVARMFPALRQVDPFAWVNRVVNELTCRFDRLLRFWPVGHCIVLQRAS